MVLAETCSLRMPIHHSNPLDWSSHENLWKASQTLSIVLELILSMDMEERPVYNIEALE